MEFIHLGHTSSIAEVYDPSILEPIARVLAREQFEPNAAQQFIGQDIWQCYELSWLTPTGRPIVAVLRFGISAASAYIVESKSLKLYLQALNMTQFSSAAKLEGIIARDLKQVLGQDLSFCELITVNSMDEHTSGPAWRIESLQAFAAKTSLNVVWLDALECSCDMYTPNASFLTGKACDDRVSYVSNQFRSLCPVTQQPDYASIVVQTKGFRFDPTLLVQYLVSFRQHGGFHEQCIERIFLDLRTVAPNQFDELSVVGRFTRRGGIDINPERHLNQHSQAASRAWQVRHWRQ